MPIDQETRAKALESEKNFKAGMTGCLGAGIGIVAGLYVVINFIVPHVTGWLGFATLGIAVIGPQIAAARWHDKQMERIRSEREQRIRRKQ